MKRILFMVAVVAAAAAAIAGATGQSTPRTVLWITVPLYADGLEPSTSYTGYFEAYYSDGRTYVRGLGTRQSKTNGSVSWPDTTLDEVSPYGFVGLAEIEGCVFPTGSPASEVCQVLTLPGY